MYHEPYNPPIRDTKNSRQIIHFYVFHQETNNIRCGDKGALHFERREEIAT